MYETHVSRKSRPISVKKITVFSSKLGEMYEKALVLKVSRKSRSNFVKNQCFFKQNCNFQGWRREREPTIRQTDRRINGLGGCGRRWLFGGFGRGEKWRFGEGVVVEEWWEKGEQEEEG